MNERGRARFARWLPPLAVAAIAFGAIRSAMLPGIGFWDTGELQTVAPIMGTAHPTGYPTYVLLGWLVNLVLTPFGEPALRMNLFAGLCVALAAGVTVDLVRALTRSTALGVITGLGLALTQVAWAIGTQAEAHALHLAFLVILFRMLFAWEERVSAVRIATTAEERAARRTSADRWLVVTAVVFGLSMGNHSLTLLLAPAVGLFVLAVDPGIVHRPRLIAACATALALTVVVVFLELPLRGGPFRAPLVYGSPQTWAGFWYVVLGAQFQDAVSGPLTDIGPKLADLVDRAAAGFGPLAILLPVGFVVAAFRRPTYAILSGVAMFVTCAFATSYTNGDIDRYYLGPTFIAWTWMALLGGELATLLRHRRDPDPDPRAARQRPDPVVAGVLAAALLLPTLLAVPNRLASVDRSTDVTARAWVERALARMRRDAVVISWWSYSTPLWYAQHVEGRRPDIAIIDDRTRLDEGLGELTDVIDAYLPSRPVYVIRIEPDEIDELQRDYLLEPTDGPTPAFLTRVVRRIPGR